VATNNRRGFTFRLTGTTACLTIFETKTPHACVGRAAEGVKQLRRPPMSKIGGLSALFSPKV
ncbi:MAG: hypothetical protein WCD76_05900, partial [Pyrinomonadaceae bacterium]